MLRKMQAVSVVWSCLLILSLKCQLAGLFPAFSNDAVFQQFLFGHDMHRFGHSCFEDEPVKFRGEIVISCTEKDISFRDVFPVFI
ncbi:MAG: hypothetical protein P1V20_01765 [Verrucomicrobiales bacterium]|nr:hypothetical protein [Verrucomicrobiales bacterium]